MSLPDAAGYKARKEAFVSNLSGSSLTDINLVTLVASVSLILSGRPRSPALSRSTGSSPPMDSPAKATIILHALRRRRWCRRLLAQCLRHSLRCDSLFVRSGITQCLPGRPCCTPVVAAHTAPASIERLGDQRQASKKVGQVCSPYD